MNTTRRFRTVTRPRLCLTARVVDFIDARPMLVLAVGVAGLAALLIRVSGVSL